MNTKEQHTPTCILWNGYIDSDGYGRTSLNGRSIGAHRVAYEKSKGPIPKGLVIDHLCRCRSCINPDHMEAVTSAENTRRGIQATKTVCNAGHPLSGKNLKIRSNGRRECKECRRIRWRAYRIRKITSGLWLRNGNRAPELVTTTVPNPYRTALNGGGAK